MAGVFDVDFAGEEGEGGVGGRGNLERCIVSGPYTLQGLGV